VRTVYRAGSVVLHKWGRAICTCPIAVPLALGASPTCAETVAMTLPAASWTRLMTDTEAGRKLSFRRSVLTSRFALSALTADEVKKTPDAAQSVGSR